MIVGTTGRTRSGLNFSRVLIAAGATVSALAAAPPALAGDGGAGSSPVPIVSGVQCHARCASLTAAQPGSVVRITGRELSAGKSVVFLGSSGSGDDVAAHVGKATEKHVDARVPRGAHSGPVEVVSDDGSVSSPSRGTIDVVAASTAAGLLDAAVASKRVYYAGRKPTAVTFVLRGTRTRDVTVDVVRLATGVSVFHKVAPHVAPGTPRTIRWNGLTRGKIAKLGRYAFRVAVDGAAGASADGQRSAPFSFLPAVFPLKGKHYYGDGFGVARSGHSHQGIDVMSRCGLPVVAARGGIVRWKAFHSAAGNYVVLHSPSGSSPDTVYMHLRRPALVKKGQRVYTGQHLGDVGETGDATACHLHFEVWTQPGWYDGGHAFDGMALLKAWDKYS